MGMLPSLDSQQQIGTNPIRNEAVILRARYLVHGDLNNTDAPLAQAEHAGGWECPLAVSRDGPSVALAAPERRGSARAPLAAVGVSA
jgi:hypothetical protein